MATRFGTCHFETLPAIMRYYGISRVEAQNKVYIGACHVGKPQCKKCEKVLIHSKERRYFIES